MTAGPEFETVERPFIEQLVAMGWKHTTGNLDFPSATSRESFREVLLLDDLRKALRRINLDDDGKEWLDDGRIAQAVSALERLGVGKLMEANQLATELLHKGISGDDREEAPKLGRASRDWSARHGASRLRSIRGSSRRGPSRVPRAGTRRSSRSSPLEEGA